MGNKSDMPLNVKDLITVDQAAELCGVDRRTIYNWLRAGTAPRHERLGDRYFFYREDAEQRRKERRG